MAKSSTFDTQLLNLLFNATAITNVADNAASSPLTNLYVSLHTADPTAAGNQGSSEAAYTGYARVAVARTSGGWTVASGTVQNAAAINFPSCTGGSSVVTYFGIGTASSGAGELLYSGALTASLSISNGITPSFQSAQLNVTES